MPEDKKRSGTGRYKDAEAKTNPHCADKKKYTDGKVR